MFSDDELQILERRYGHLPARNRPLVYSIATEEKFVVRKTELEQGVADLPLAERSKIVPRLLSGKDTQFREASNEMAIGQLLRKCGFETQHEKKWRHLTPDWHIKAEDCPEFYVEVFTINQSRDDHSADHQLSDLLSRIEAIPIGAILSITAYRQETQLTQKRNKSICGQVRAWLRQQPPIGTACKVDNVSFEVSKYDDSYEKVAVVAGTGAFWVNPRPLRERFEEKISKYSKLATLDQMPFVVAAVAEPITGLGSDDFVDALVGEEAHNVTFDQSTGAVLSQRAFRRNNGLLATKPETLSAAIWAYRSFDNRWKARVINNPFARFPLSAEVLDRLSSD